MPTPQILMQLSIRRNKSAPWMPRLATHRTQRIRQTPQALCPCLDGFDLPWRQWHAVLMLWLICVIKPSVMMTMLPFKRTCCQPVSRPQSKKKKRYALVLLLTTVYCRTKIVTFFCSIYWQTLHKMSIMGMFLMT